MQSNLKAGVLSPTKPVQFIRKMRGGAQSSLIEAEDGNFYIIKFPDNPQGPDVLFHEAFGTELMGLVGLPVSDWRPVRIHANFIDQNRGLWFEGYGSALRPPRPGLCFGSRLVSATDQESLYEMLPSSWFELISNRTDFLGMLLFDLWALHNDNRQAVFLQDLQTRLIRATFIDHGALFGKLSQAGLNVGRRTTFLDDKVYRNTDVSSILPKWEARIRALTIDGLYALVFASSIPCEWYDPCKVDEILTGLLERQAQTSTYISQITSFLNEQYERREHREDVRIQGAELRSDSLSGSRTSVPRSRRRVLP